MKPKDEKQTVVQWGVAKSGARTFACFGVARGGTSAVAGMMRKLGLYMGDCPVNNHEDPEFIGKPNPHRINIIKERNAAHEVWGWKDPNAANYLHEVRPQLINPHYICVFRDSCSVAIAHMRWHGREARFAFSEIFTQQQRNLFRLMNLNDPCLLVSYEKLIANPVAFTQELADFLGVPQSVSDREIVEFLVAGSYKN